MAMHWQNIFSDGSAPNGFDLKNLSGQIRQGADMMDSASSLLKKITSTFGSKWFITCEENLKYASQCNFNLLIFILHYVLTKNK